MRVEIVSQILDRVLTKVKAPVTHFMGTITPFVDTTIHRTLVSTRMQSLQCADNPKAESSRASVSRLVLGDRAHRAALSDGVPAARQGDPRLPRRAAARLVAGAAQGHPADAQVQRQPQGRVGSIAAQSDVF